MLFVIEFFYETEIIMLDYVYNTNIGEDLILRVNDLRKKLNVMTLPELNLEAALNRPLCGLFLVGLLIKCNSLNEKCVIYVLGYIKTKNFLVLL